MRLDVVVPIEVTRGLNDREHYRARAKRVKAERDVTNDELWTMGAGLVDALAGDHHHLGARVTLLRPYARVSLDSDNLSGAFKGVRDEVASFLGVDDKSERVHWRYVQCKARKVDGGARPRLSLGLDTHIRIRIEIVPAADVDPLLTAVRVLRESIVEYIDADGSINDAGMHEALATANALATFDPQELYNVR